MSIPAPRSIEGQLLVPKTLLDQLHLALRQPLYLMHKSISKKFALSEDFFEDKYGIFIAHKFNCCRFCRCCVRCSVIGFLYSFLKLDHCCQINKY